MNDSQMGRSANVSHTGIPPSIGPIVVAITGASGAIYAHRLLQVLASTNHPIELTISPAGATVFEQELGMRLNLTQFDLRQLRIDEDSIGLQTGKVTEANRGRIPTFDGQPGSRIRYHDHRDFLAPIASGSHRTNGMVICPCSGGTVSSVVVGASNNLIHRAADVHLKEGRRLILVPRETPLSLVHLENLRRAVEVGATVLPASPGWYHGVRSLYDLVDFVVARILDQLRVDNGLIQRWGDEERPVSSSFDQN